jgi:hypothetical protein
MDRILITGGRAPVALELARQLSQAGKKVFVADSAPCFLTSACRSVVKAFRVPRPRQSPQLFADAIESIVDSERIEQIIPTCEEVFYLSRFAHQLRCKTELFCMDFEALKQLHDKWSFSQQARGYGIEVPETWLLDDLHSFNELPLPPDELVFKPVYSRFAVHTLIKPSKTLLNKFQASANRPWVAQRFVSGREMCSYAVARDGKLTAHALYEPLWRAGKSSSYYFSAVSRPAIEAFSSNFVAAKGYTGQIAFDFIEAADGKIYVLECNPRATSGVHLFVPQDGLAAAFEPFSKSACVGESAMPGGASPRSAGVPPASAVVRPSSAQPRMLASIMAVLGPLQALRGAQFGRLISDFSRARDAVWNAGDPFPSFYSFVGIGAFLCIALREGINPIAASTHDIEWDGQEIVRRP